ncbi:MAG: hypothetical protein II712_04300 [Erysipelotrichaceae bacterium]|nr:hypothetical protein [Erysipelotrichaceae bacterium]MBQ4254031.1 hypothetical protein [Erysipelotrichaceae bacterium]
MKNEEIVIIGFIAIFIIFVLPMIRWVLKAALILGAIAAVFVLLNYKKTKKEIADDPDEYFRKQKEERENGDNR